MRMNRITIQALLPTAALVLAIHLPSQAATAPTAPTATQGQLPITASLTRIFAGGTPETLKEFVELETYVQALYEKVLPCTVNLGGGTGVMLEGGLILSAGHVTAPPALPRRRQQLDRERFRGLTDDEKDGGQSDNKRNDRPLDIGPCIPIHSSNVSLFSLFLPSSGQNPYPK